MEEPGPLPALTYPKPNMSGDMWRLQETFGCFQDRMYICFNTLLQFLSRGKYLLLSKPCANPYQPQD